MYYFIIFWVARYVLVTCERSTIDYYGWDGLLQWVAGWSQAAYPSPVTGHSSSWMFQLHFQIFLSLQDEDLFYLLKNRILLYLIHWFNWQIFCHFSLWRIFRLIVVQSNLCGLLHTMRHPSHGLLLLLSCHVHIKIFQILYIPSIWFLVLLSISSCTL